jgi:hypothetical protein
MLRTSLAVIAMILIGGAAQAADDATSETDAIQLDQGTEPGSSMQKAPSTLPDPGEASEMEESDVINN